MGYDPTLPPEYGGVGGTISITAASFGGTGFLTALGGKGNPFSSGGGGGRIAVAAV